MKASPIRKSCLASLAVLAAACPRETEQALLATAQKDARCNRSTDMSAHWVSVREYP
jgi:hypothetical protein